VCEFPLLLAHDRHHPRHGAVVPLMSGCGFADEIDCVACYSDNVRHPCVPYPLCHNIRERQMSRMGSKRSPGDEEEAKEVEKLIIRVLQLATTVDSAPSDHHSLMVCPRGRAPSNSSLSPLFSFILLLACRWPLYTDSTSLPLVNISSRQRAARS
jgi:hypothetical protein